MNELIDTKLGVGFRQTTSESFPESYFYEELGRFRELLCSQSFWMKDEEHREAAIRGLTFVYLNTVPNDNSKVTREHIEKWKVVFVSTLTEYNRRGTLMILHPLTDTRPHCPECKRPHGVARDSDGVFRCHMVNHVVPVDC